MKLKPLQGSDCEYSYTYSNNGNSYHVWIVGRNMYTHVLPKNAMIEMADMASMRYELFFNKDNHQRSEHDGNFFDVAFRHR